jgi:hypothetical protein
MPAREPVRATSSQPNAVAVERIAAARPTFGRPVTAGEAIGLAQGELAHAGPPFEDGQRPPPTVLNALAGACVHEGWATSLDQARSMILQGEIRLRANHELGVVSPMAGVVRPGQTLYRIEDRAGGSPTYATLAEKGRRVLRFGAYGPDVAAQLAFVEGAVAEAIDRAMPDDGLEVLPLVSAAAAMGDDTHQRNVGGMLVFLAHLKPLPAEIHAWLASHPQHFLNYAMAAAKMCLDRAQGVVGSTIVTAITRNGIDCGIQVAGAGARWFKAPSPQPVGGFFAGFRQADAHNDLGDSAIMETFGYGGCMAHASPEIAKTMGREWDEASAEGRAMRRLFVGRHEATGPALAGEAGLGLGLDAARVAASGRGVRIHTGISHRDGETGWIGIGVAEAPLGCFAAATEFVNRTLTAEASR